MRAMLTSSLLLLGVACLLGCGENADTPDSERTPKPASSPTIRRDRKGTPPDFERMPLHLGRWKATDMALDPEIRAAIGAEMVVDRVYAHSEDSVIKIPQHLAVFSNWDNGVNNNPIRCYLSGRSSIKPMSMCTPTA